MAAFQLLTPELNSNVVTANVLMATTTTAGMVITTTGVLADANTSPSLVYGILLDDATSGKFGVIVRPSTLLDVTPVLTEGGILILSETPGLVKYANEIASTEGLVVVGYCTLTTQIRVAIDDTLIVKT